jgi:PAS domain S-box-containing protein
MTPTNWPVFLHTMGSVTVLRGIMELLGGIFFLLVLLPDWRGAHPPLHAVMEGVESFAALCLMAVLLLLRLHKRFNPRYLWISGGLATMGILGGAHAITPLGPLADWYRALGTLLGGFSFALVWLNKSRAKSPVGRHYPLIMAGLCFVLILLSPALPLQTLATPQWGFTHSLFQIMNSLGGLLFLTAWMFYAMKPHKVRISNRVVFASYCLLSGMAALLVAIAPLWSAGWWLWHGLRMLADGMVLLHLLVLYDRDNHTLRELNHNLEERIHKSTRALAEELTRRQEAEMRLSRDKAQADLLLEHVGGVMVILDQTGKVERINQRGCELLIHSPQSLIGQDWWMTMLPPEQRAVRQHAFEQWMAHPPAEDTPPHTLEPIQTGAGTIRLFSWRPRILRTADGAVAGLFLAGMPADIPTATPPF